MILLIAAKHIITFLVRGRFVTFWHEIVHKYNNNCTWYVTVEVSVITEQSRRSVREFHFFR